MTSSLISKTVACALALTCLIVPVSLGAVATKKKPHASATARSTAGKAGQSKGRNSKGKNSKATAKKQATRKPGPFRQSYVPVPQARPVAPAAPATEPATQEPETAGDSLVAVPPPVDAALDSPAGLRDSTVDSMLVHGKSALHFAAALKPYFEALRAQQRPGSTATVRTLQFGDSHTAADMFSGELRAQMQSRFGNGGVGFSYAGHPFAGYRILGSGRGESGGWQTLGTHFTQLGDALLGMGGVAIETSRPGESAQLDVNCTTLQIDYLRQPGGGSFSIRDNEETQAQVSTDVAGALDAFALPLPSPQAGASTFSCKPGLNNFQFVTAGDGPVRLLGTTALQPGATWEAMGINGAEAPLMRRWNASLFDSYLQHAAPQLIVLAYGTNEAAARWTQEDYGAAFTQLIDKLHSVAPGASILVLAPGDRSIATSRSTVTGKGRNSRRKVSRVYKPYLGTGRILVAQRDVCRTHGCAFWDWSARQGGFGSMQRWVAAGYAQPDHTHFTGTGYRALADALYADLMSAYESFLSGQR